MVENPVLRRSTNRFETVLEPAERRRLDDVLVRQRSLVDGRGLWHVNSTARGGGVFLPVHHFAAELDLFERILR